VTVIDRRSLLKSAAAIYGCCAFGVRAGEPGAMDAPVRARLRIHPDRELNRIPLSYNGFSIETATLANPQIYRVENRSLVSLFRCLTTNGVLRIGGNSSEFCWWKASAEAQAPEIRIAGQGRADNWMPQRLTAITPEAIDNLRGFLDATGWSCIYGLNFGTGSPERDAAEAEYVARRLGAKLKYFQIGNEPDFYREPNNRLRPAGWDFPDYLHEWLDIARAVIERVPTARFGGPDVGSSADWVVRFGREAPKALGPRLLELTGHYYAQGPPDSPHATIENLLADDPRIAERMNAIMPVARRNGLTFRMAEGNSCFRGGKAGMSNALAGALWGMDYMLDMAARGCQGINLHGGGGAEISSALGDKLPGARDARDLEIAKLGTFYSPVAGNPAIGYRPRPLFYGMMAVEQFAGGTLVETDLEAPGVNAKAYAARTGKGWRIALVNKDLKRDLEVQVSIPDGVRQARVWRLTAPAIDATENVTLAGAEVTAADADWSPRQVDELPVRSGDATVSVRRGSAAIVFGE
jgi:hypothetical protein